MNKQSGKRILLHYYSTLLVTIILVGGLLSVEQPADLVFVVFFIPVVVYLWLTAFQVSFSSPISPKPDSQKKKKEPKEVVDKDKRNFLKVLGSVGIGSAFYFLLTKNARALSFGSSTVSDPVGLKDTGGSEINPATSGKQDEIVALQDNYLVKIDENSSTVTYIGKAAIGSADSDSAWQIQKIDESANPTSIEWADGNDSFDNIWENRDSYSYS